MEGPGACSGPCPHSRAAAVLAVAAMEFVCFFATGDEPSITTMPLAKSPELGFPDHQHWRGSGETVFRNASTASSE